MDKKKESKIRGPKKKNKESEVMDLVKRNDVSGVDIICCKCKHFRSNPGRCSIDQSHHAKKSVGCVAWEKKGR